MTVLDADTQMPRLHLVFGDPAVWVESATDQSQLSIVTTNIRTGDLPTALALSYSFEQVFYVDIYNRTVKMIDISTNIISWGYLTASANVCDVSFQLII
jgi:hypothetical protein